MRERERAFLKWRERERVLLLRLKRKKARTIFIKL